jgi:hypothetical protein
VSSDASDSRRDPRQRPSDPAGTRPRHDPESLLPERRPPLPRERSDLLPERRDAASVGPARRASPYAPRFQFLTGGLLAVGLAAIAAIAVLAIGSGGSNTSGERGPAWSTWKPTATGVAGAQQIAQHVGVAYRANGRQLVNVETNGLAFKGTPLAVALRRPPDEGGAIQIHDDDGVLFQLCGIGADCAISTGKPSSDRGFLLRREGLELALYAMHYLDVKQVVVLMPPAIGSIQSIALYFRRDDLAQQLAVPLTHSLAPQVPTVKTATTSPDAAVVHRATAADYLFTLTGSSFNANGFLVLDPYTPAGDAELQKQARAQRADALAAATSATATTTTP